MILDTLYHNKIQTFSLPYLDQNEGVMSISFDINRFFIHLRGPHNFIFLGSGVVEHVFGTFIFLKSIDKHNRPSLDKKCRITQRKQLKVCKKRFRSITNPFGRQYI